MNVALWLLTDLLRVDLSVKTINVIVRQANLLKSLPLNKNIQNLPLESMPYFSLNLL